MIDNLLVPERFLLILAIFAAGAFGALILRHHDRAANLWSHTLAILGSSLGLWYAGASLLQGTTPALTIATAFPSLSVTIRIDPLSAYFMLVICLISLFCSIYAVGYVRHYYGKYSIGVLGFFYNIFIASMLLVVTVHHALCFLVVWELMSLASYFLVIYEHREVASIRAGTLYFAMTHVGTAFILLSFLIMHDASGSFDFAAIKNGLAHGSPLTTGAIFLTALVGFGTKAGIIPLHIWLPSAHPAAPSHVSALMSGVMIKTGIYMLIRISLEMLPPGPLWWGITILTVGAISAVLGVLHALAEHDLKRLLANHSIENIGIILLGVGSALVFSSLGMKSLASLALIAALFHTLNHATFKALLFLGSGAVISATHTRNIEEYGGLIKRMPQTALFFLIGAMAISALPPFNGFFSEWMTFQAMFNGVSALDVMTGFPFILAIGALALTGGLAAACFVKVVGATFLARPRSEAAANAQEAAFSSRLGMASLALLTLVLGIGSGVVFRFLNSISITLLSPTEELSSSMQFQSVSIINGFATLSGPAIFGLIVLAVAVTSAGVYALAGTRVTKTAATWSCGTELTSRMEITATGFSRSIVTVFKGVLRPSRQTEIEYHDERLRYFPKTSKVTLHMRDLYQPYIYEPLRMLTNRAAEQFKRIQSGNINAYIVYIFITLIGLLFILVI